MADISYSLFTGLSPGLGVKPAIEGGLRSWLIKGSFQASTTSTASFIELDNVNVEELVCYIAYDLERFAFASWESYAVACEENRSHNLLGWPLLKLYYSAFFAAHAIMRGQGQGIVKLERNQTNHLNQMLAITSGVNPNITAGMYLYRLDKGAQGRQSVFLEPHTPGRGVHDSFWETFAQFLNQLSAKASQNKAADASLFVAGTTEVVNSIKSGSDGVFLSSVRNEINYQHKYNIWYPVKKGKEIKSVIEDLGVMSSSAIRLDVSKRKSPVTSFANTSKFLACLNHEVSVHLAARSTLSGAFGQKWRRLNDLLK